MGRMAGAEGCGWTHLVPDWTANAMDLPPFLLDQFMATYEFASPAIRYNLAASAGPVWTFGELMALGGDAKRELDELRISYIPVAFPWWLDGRDARPMCEVLAREGVLTAPGECFDASDHFRLAFGGQASGFQDALAIASRVFRGSRPRLIRL